MKGPLPSIYITNFEHLLCNRHCFRQWTSVVLVAWSLKETGFFSKNNNNDKKRTHEEDSALK